jgi:hypothetical protein
LRNLPVAPHPAVFTPRVGAIVRRVIVDNLDIRGQTDTSIRSLNQVVAEQGIARKAPVQNRVQRIDLVNALAGKHAFPIEVLIGV